MGSSLGPVTVGEDGASISGDVNGPPIFGVPTLASGSVNLGSGMTEVCYGPGFYDPGPGLGRRKFVSTMVIPAQ